VGAEYSGGGIPMDQANREAGGVVFSSPLDRVVWDAIEIG